MEAGTLSVSLGVDVADLQRGLDTAQKSVQDFSRNAAAAGSGLQAFNEEATQMATLQAQLGLELGLVQRQLGDLATAYQSVTDPRLERQIVGETAALQQQARALQDRLAALRATEGAQAGYARSTGLANNVTLEFSRGLGDLAYGWRGVVNNAEQGIAQFGLLVKQSGGVRAALGALGGSLLGPIGIVAGFTALTTLGPKLASFFSETEGNAEDTADQIERIASAVKSIIDVDTTGLSKFNVTVDGLKLAALQADARVRDLKDQIKDFDVFRTDDKAISDLNALKNRLVEAEGAYSAFLREISTRRGTGVAADILRDLGFEEITDGAGEKVRQVREEFARLKPIIDENAESIVGLFQEIRDNRLPDLFENDRARNRQVSALLEIPRQIDVIKSKTLELGEAFRVVFGLGAGFVDDLARSFGDAVFSLFDFGGALSEAEQILARLDFEDARDRLREAFEEGTISAERYSAELAVLEERQAAFAASLNPITRAFKTLADGVVQSMKRVVAAIAEAIAKALILKALGAIFPTGTRIGNFIEGISQSGGFGRPVGVSAPQTVGVARAASPVATLGRGADGDLAREIRAMRADLRSYAAVIERVQTDPNAARRMRDRVSALDATKNPRVTTL